LPVDRLEPGVLDLIAGIAAAQQTTGQRQLALAVSGRLKHGDRRREPDDRKPRVHVVRSNAAPYALLPAPYAPSSRLTFPRLTTSPAFTSFGTTTEKKGAIISSHVIRPM